VLLAALAAVGLVAVIIAGYVFVQFNQADDPWRAQVLSIDGKTVCTKPDKGEKDPGWAVPFCMDEGLVTEDGGVLMVEPGACVLLRSSHPVFYAIRPVPCA
jgi:hypothetical protein